MLLCSVRKSWILKQQSYGELSKNIKPDIRDISYWSCFESFFRIDISFGCSVSGQSGEAKLNLSVAFLIIFISPVIFINSSTAGDNPDVKRFF